MGDLDSYVVPDRAYYHEMEKVLKAKADDIMTYFRTKNHKIQYLDVSLQLLPDLSKAACASFFFLRNSHDINPVCVCV